MKIFFLGLVMFLVADAIFLGFFVKNFWKRELGLSMRDNITLKSMLIPGLIVYALLALGIILFVLPRTLEASNLMTFFLGLVFGMIVYGVYDMTNYIIITNYTLRLALMDIVWGSFISGIVSLILKILSSKYI